MAKEFVIKHGFISKGDSIVSGSLSGETLNLTNSLFLNNLETQVLVRNNTTGLVEYRDASTFSGASGSNTFVTGFTYNDNNTFTISDSAGSAFTATINQVSGLTVNGTLSATTLDGGTIFSGGTNLLTIIDDRDDFVTGTTFGSNQAILTRNDGTEVFKLSGSSSVQLTNPSGNKIDIDVTIPAGMNTFVTGYTYDDNNTFTINDNLGSAFTASINQVSGLTVNGTLSATTLDGGTILSGGTNLLTIIESLDTYVTGGTINLSATTNTNSATIGLLYKNSEGIPHTLPFDDTFTTGGTYDNGTTLITFDKNDGSKYNVDLSTIDVNDTFVTGTTFASNQATLTRNDGTEVLKLTGGTNVTLSNPSTNQIKLDVTIPAGMNTYVTGFTYNDNNTFTISDSAGSAFTATINQVSGLTVNGKVITTQLQVTSSPTNGYVLTSDALGNATWQAAGGGGTTLRNVSGTTTFATDNETINCTSGTFIVNLPTAVGIQGTTYTLVNSGTGVITLDPSTTQTINGSTTIDLTQYISRTVQSDGSNWIII